MQKSKHFFSGLVASAIIVLQLLNGTVHAAGGFTMDPSSVSVLKDGQMTIVVRGTGAGFNAAQIDLSYDSAKLQYISYSITGSELSTVAAFAQSSGSIKLTPYTTSSATGDNLFLASFTFKALSDSGSSAITLLSSSALVANGLPLFSFSGISSQVNFATATTTPPAPTPTPAPVPKPSPQPSTKTSAPQTTKPTTTPSVTTPSTDTTPPVIASTLPAGYVGQTISIKVTTNEPTRSIVKFGDSSDSLLQTATSEGYASSYYVSLGTVSNAFLKDKTYYYVVEAIDAAGNKTTSGVETIDTSTVKLFLTIKDASNVALPNTTIVVNGQEFRTDSKGVAKITGIVRGVVAVSIKIGETLQYLGDISTVKGSSTQAYEVSPTSIKQVNSMLVAFPVLRIGTYAAIALASLIAGAIAIRSIVRARAERREIRLHSTNPWGHVKSTSPIAPAVSSMQQQNNSADLSSQTVAEPVSDPQKLTISGGTAYAPETVFAPQNIPQPDATEESSQDKEVSNS